MEKEKEDEKMEKFKEALDTNFPELVAYFKITEDGKHIFEFYKKIEERYCVPKGTNVRRKLELVGVLERVKNRDGTCDYKPTYVADVDHIWPAMLNITLNLHGVCVDTSW